MYTRIIAPLDGSALAERVVPYARTLARELRLPVTLLQVIDPNLIASFSHPAKKPGFDNVAAGMKASSVDYLRKLAPLFGEFVKVDPSVEIGNPAEAIVGKAASDPNILIAMTTHGHSSSQRWVMGSVAGKVLRAARNHLLLVRPDDEPVKINEEILLKTVLVPLDGSRLAETVLPVAMELAQVMRAQVILLRGYALAMSIYGADEDFAPQIDQLNARLRVEAKEYLDRKVRELKEKGLEKVSSVLLEGSGPTEIIDFAKKTPDSLVAMCTHGRSGIGRWVLGSVTERVAQYSGDPVLIVRA
jgi:nucleotide-binding universal stress UspA family protein